MSNSATTWTTAHQASLSSTISQSLHEFMAIESVMQSNHLIFCRSLLLLPLILPSIRVLSNELTLCIRWSVTLSISLSNEYSELTSFRIDCFDLLAVQWTLKGLLQHPNSKKPIVWRSVFFMAQLSHLSMTTGRTIVLTIQTFVGKVMSLLSNTLSRFVIAFLPRSKCFLISWLQSLSSLILEPKKRKSVTASTFSHSTCHEVMGLNAMVFSFSKVEFQANFFTLFFHPNQEVL